MILLFERRYLKNHKTLDTPSCFHIENEITSTLFFQTACETK